MAFIRPFRALRPRPDLAARIAAVPYDVVNRAEARALAHGNPHSFLHVSRADIDLPDTVAAEADAVYTRAWETFEAFRSSFLIEDPLSRLYVYRLTMGEHVQTGVAGAFSLQEYRDNRILKHETTRKAKEDDRTRHITELRAQTGPVLLTYVRSPHVDSVIASVTARPPLYDFVADDGVAHTVWQADEAETAGLVEGFAGVPSLFIADGHHRAASAARASDALGAGPEDEAAFFLAVAFPDVQMRILPYHRVVKDLHGQTVEAFLTALSQRLPVEAGSAEPARQGECAMYIKGRWYRLRLDGDEATVEGQGDPTASLDAARLSRKVLGPLLGIEDLRTDPRIDFVGGIRGSEALATLVDQGEAAVAFAMYPVSVGEVMAIAEAGGVMPPKSTWFEPKLRDGLLSREI